MSDAYLLDAAPADVMAGRCGPCRRAGRRCWCGRRVSSLAGGNGRECAEHDTPVDDPGPSTPLTPGGVFDRRYP